MPHEHFSFDRFECTYFLEDDAKKSVKLIWRSRAKDGDYELTIDSVAGTAAQRPYSLYTLCVQGRDHAVEVKVVSGQGVIFWADENKTTKIVAGASGEFVIPATGRVGGGTKPDKKGICFIEFAANQCKLEIDSKRAIVSAKMDRTNPTVSAHDTIPDPPLSGGEE